MPLCVCGWTWTCGRRCECASKGVWMGGCSCARFYERVCEWVQASVSACEYTIVCENASECVKSGN